jgi:hypothetical protein
MACIIAAAPVEQSIGANNNLMLQLPNDQMVTAEASHARLGDTSFFA